MSFFRLQSQTQTQSQSKKTDEKSSSSSSYSNVKFRQAVTVCENIPLSHLLQCTIYQEELHHIVVKYGVLKTFAHPEIFPHIAHYMVDVCMQCRQRFDGFSLHVDIEGLSVTGVERYKDLISNLLALCAALNTDFSDCIDVIHVYNTPPSIDMIRSLLMPFLEPVLREKLHFV